MIYHQQQQEEANGTKHQWMGCQLGKVKNLLLLPSAACFSAYFYMYIYSWIPWATGLEMDKSNAATNHVAAPAKLVYLTNIYY